MIFHRYFLGLSNKPFANESEAPKAQDKETDPQFPVSAFERSRWRGGRFACYALQVMPQRSASNSKFRFSLFFLSPAKSLDYRGKRIQLP